MNYSLFLSLFVGYLVLLVVIGRWTSKGGSNHTFFTANRGSHWLLVSFGMIGTSLSGVTFISVPGWPATSGMTYMLMVVGFLLGYIVIATVLLPVYYRSGVVSIYSYLGSRLGLPAHKTGSFFFLLSRTVGASARLFIVALVMQTMICDPLGIPFWQTALAILAFIALYSAIGGIATLVITDTLQTVFMLLAAALAFYAVGSAVVPPDEGWLSFLRDAPENTWVYTEGPKSWWRQLLGGLAIAVSMTGLDQDMMQKNLTVPHLRQSQNNVVLLGVNLIFVNLIFLALGIFLNRYAQLHDLSVEGGEYLFVRVITQPQFSVGLQSVFFIGLLAAAFSSADSALTALTTAFCVDFLDVQPEEGPRRRYLTYAGVLVVVFLALLGLRALDSKSIIDTLFTAAGYTYGPLLGMFAFAMLHRSQTFSFNWSILALGIASPLLAWALSLWAPTVGYAIGFELILYNAGFMYLGLRLLSLGKGSGSVQTGVRP